jgi:hypothetical protein
LNIWLSLEVVLEEWGKPLVRQVVVLEAIVHLLVENLLAAALQQNLQFL